MKEFLFEEFEIPTWKTLKAEIKSLPFGKKTELANMLGVTSARISNLTRQSAISHELFLKINRAMKHLNDEETTSNENDNR